MKFMQSLFLVYYSFRRLTHLFKTAPGNRFNPIRPQQYQAVSIIPCLSIEHPCPILFHLKINVKCKFACLQSISKSPFYDFTLCFALNIPFSSQNPCIISEAPV